MHPESFFLLKRNERKLGNEEEESKEMREEIANEEFI
jgi:hypothetical protein